MIRNAQWQFIVDCLKMYRYQLIEGFKPLDALREFAKNVGPMTAVPSHLVWAIDSQVASMYDAATNGIPIPAIVPVRTITGVEDGTLVVLR